MYRFGMPRQRLDVVDITGEDGAAGFGGGHDDGVDRGAPSGLGAEGRGSSCSRFADAFVD